MKISLHHSWARLLIQKMARKPKIEFLDLVIFKKIASSDKGFVREGDWRVKEHSLLERRSLYQLSAIKFTTTTIYYEIK